MFYACKHTTVYYYSSLISIAVSVSLLILLCKYITCICWIKLYNITNIFNLYTHLYVQIYVLALLYIHTIILGKQIRAILINKITKKQKIKQKKVPLYFLLLREFNYIIYMYVHILYVEDVAAGIEMYNIIIHTHWYAVKINSYLCLKMYEYIYIFVYSNIYTCR